LDVLLHLSGIEDKIKRSHFVEWSVIGKWDPNARYKPIGSATKADAEEMVTSARTLVRKL